MEASRLNEYIVHCGDYYVVEDMYFYKRGNQINLSVHDICNCINKGSCEHVRSCPDSKEVIINLNEKTIGRRDNKLEIRILNAIETEFALFQIQQYVSRRENESLVLKNTLALFGVASDVLK